MEVMNIQTKKQIKKNQTVCYVSRFWIVFLSFYFSYFLLQLTNFMKNGKNKEYGTMITFEWLLLINFFKQSFDNVFSFISSIFLFITFYCNSQIIIL